MFVVDDFFLEWEINFCKIFIQNKNYDMQYLYFPNLNLHFPKYEILRSEHCIGTLLWCCPSSAWSPLFLTPLQIPMVTFGLWSHSSLVEFQINGVPHLSHTWRNLMVVYGIWFKSIYMKTSTFNTWKHHHL